VKAVYHPYWNWEDWKAGMWFPVYGESKKRLLKEAIEFTGTAKLYGEYMGKVILAWPVASEHNLTNASMNRLAWIGHAATFYAIQCPEMITREAWGHLSEQQRNEANDEAQKALNAWSKFYAGKDTCLF
jgi:hypothetical protein